MEQFYPVFIALGFNGLDLLTGFVSAVKNKEIQSDKLRDGLFKKIGFMFCYFIAWILDEYGVLIGFEVGVKLLPIVIFYTCTTELVSILENINKINPDLLPGKLMEMFHVKH